MQLQEILYNFYKHLKLHRPTINLKRMNEGMNKYENKNGNREEYKNVMLKGGKT
jgi:hypothetical protein